MKKTVYIETTIPSYATARESPNIITQARQVITKAFWESERDHYHFYTSQETHDEAKKGDPKAAARRIKFLEGIEKLEITDEVRGLADTYKELLGIPDRAASDSVHMAVCVSNNIDWLLTWNCTHMGAFAQEKIAEYNSKRNLWVPKLLTPEQLMELIVLEAAKAESTKMEENNDIPRTT